MGYAIACLSKNRTLNVHSRKSGPNFDKAHVTECPGHPWVSSDIACSELVLRSDLRIDDQKCDFLDESPHKNCNYWQTFRIWIVKKTSTCKKNIIIMVLKIIMVPKLNKLGGVAKIWWEFAEIRWQNRNQSFEGLRLVIYGPQLESLNPKSF